MATEPFIGEIKMVGFNFAPRGWALCSGQILSIAQNTALFSLLGTTYGGNGQSTFGLPDLRGRFPTHSGQGPGLSSRSLGEVSGTESVTLLSTQMPMHTHAFTGSLACSNQAGNSDSPVGAFPAPSGSAEDFRTTSNASMAPGAVTGTVAIAGGSQPVGIMNPYLCVNFIIALQGIFPSRN